MEVNCQKSFMLLVVSVLFLAFQPPAATASTGKKKEKPTDKKLLLLSMDGFRYDYLSRANTPNFDVIIESGVSVPYMNCTFPTLTFPSHNSISTGLYPESHGIVLNRFFGPALNRTFSLSSLEPEWWAEAEPFWINAVRSGLKVGAFNWAGSNVPHNGLLPTAYRDFDRNAPYDVRVHTAVDWLARDDFNLSLVYFEEPDRSGHDFGPTHARTALSVERMDTIVGMFLRAIDYAGLKDKIDLMVFSDHGITDIDTQNKVIKLDDYVDDTLLARSVQWYGAVLHLIPQPGKARQLVEALSGIEHMHVYLREEMPHRLHYSNNPRIAPVIAFSDEGWLISINEERIQTADFVATHGFDPELMSMKTIFTATGPSFKAGYRLPGAISTLDIYPLVCHLLGLTPAPNNGSLDRIMPLLSSSYSRDVALLLAPSALLGWLCCLATLVFHYTLS